MNFEEHLANHRLTDGGFDKDAAEEDRRYELESNPEELLKLAAKVAKQERIAWENREGSTLRKQFEQPPLSPALEMEVMVPVGKSTVYRYGDMDHLKIQLRKDLRTKTHIDENRRYEIEWTHWTHTEELLNNGETIEDAIARGDSA